ncbi:MerR family transcriptional regulator [Candidatus Enterococcus murrayae]|uniref:MerR family transcriptional regulator n=1 Tax=Candidatus Enterococcus murrayae TaxID=2815321 RepID=A0ABS3HI55_9ENTE|nr:MerR family transcriptional regulator [Enterococcus sp. MJM16]MBO0452268.1 MerR family transcriptional regulator [Enterococcus sp. MJM16]
MNIKEVSEKYDLTPDTLRYYERIGVIPPIARDKNGYRDFSDTDLNWVYFAKVLRNAGVSIEGLIDYTRLSRDGGETLGARKAILQEHLEEAEEKIKALEEARDYLKYKLDNYDTHMVAYENEKLKINNEPV